MTFSPRVLQAADAALKAVRPVFEEIERIEELCSARVLDALAEFRVSEAHLLGTTGYGYGDIGRDTLDRIYARVYGTEEALVRIQFASGTATLAAALSGVLRPGDRALAVTGMPYDTIQPTIGFNHTTGDGSLADFGISFDVLPFDGTFDYDAVVKAAEGYTMAYVQRSRGYALRRSLTADEITELTRRLHAAYPDIIIFVDNCYGEFVCEQEPEADLLVGSLIKNAGGGLCPCGGYVAGRADLVRKVAQRQTAIGIGGEVGATLNTNRSMFMGLFMAPHATAESKKTAVFAAEFFRQLGFESDPLPTETRGDIIQLLKLGTPARLIAFCKGLQSGSPIDSHVSPEPWDMPGYDDPVIMAAGGFISGSSVEISADAPLRDPFCVWLQGGLTFRTAKHAVMKAAQNVLDLENE
ncbi:MAG: methionine gamma-lyase family protein [Clostridia bacterium]|nr:methionine gamma-lyase family protein [Clostridia bacterium]